jgi:ribosomal protein L29
MKAKDLRSKTILELSKMADDLRKKISQLMIEKSLNKLKNPSMLKLLKKDLARTLTIINEKQKQEK